jgi:hypothetical protein
MAGKLSPEADFRHNFRAFPQCKRPAVPAAGFLFLFSAVYQCLWKHGKCLLDAICGLHIAGTRRRQPMRKFILAAIAAFSARLAKKKSRRETELSWA